MRAIRAIRNFRDSVLLADRSAVTAVEYAILTALIAVVIIGSVTLLGHQIEGVFSNIATQMSLLIAFANAPKFSLSEFEKRMVSSVYVMGTVTIRSTILRCLSFRSHYPVCELLRPKGRGF